MHRETRLGASSLALGNGLALKKCKSEILERWAHFEWEASGSPELAHFKLCDGQRTDPYVEPETVRRDGSGMCAGPEVSRADILIHGLLEVIERDAVTRLLGFGGGRVIRIPVQLPTGLTALADRWGGDFENFLCDTPGLPPVCITVFSTRRGDAGAVGSACRLNVNAASTHAATEALMMYTTARHWSRQAEVPPQYSGILWASRHMPEVREELRSCCGFGGVPTAALTPKALMDAVVSRFGTEPKYLRYPVRAARFPGMGAWRVIVPGALSPAVITRQPWPIG
ncbi:YcaO-like family protein [Streptomyces sp. NPDC002952]|uniref:YcaO-like family protein n=1 Tax=Streptomyces sp. NPDC002952 TaxID=3364673 RepID=UPI0036B157E7